MTLKQTNLVTVIALSIIVSGCASTPAQKAAMECGLKGAGLGLLGGAAAGAITAAATGKDMGKSVLIGAGAGAVVGATWAATNCYISAAHQTETVEDYSIAKGKLHYDASQGDKVKIANFTVSPKEVMTGGQLNVESNYYVMIPDEKRDVAVVEQWSMEKIQEVEKKEWVEKQVPTEKKVRVKRGGKHRTITETVMETVKVEEVKKEKTYTLIPDASSNVTVNLKPGKHKSTTTLPIDANTPKGMYRLNLLVQYGVQSDKSQQEFTVQ